MRPSSRYQRDADLLREFRTAYVDLINSTRPEQDGFLLRFVSSIDPVAWQEKRRRLAAASGRAADAYRQHGQNLDFRNPAYIMRDVNPILNWEMSLRDPEQMSPETVVTAVDAAEAAARHLAEEAAQRERGVVGVIAAFLRWPSELREAVGRDHPGQHKAAGVLGVAAQILVGALATALGAGVIAGVTALWRVVFSS